MPGLDAEAPDTAPAGGVASSPGGASRTPSPAAASRLLASIAGPPSLALLAVTLLLIQLRALRVPAPAGADPVGIASRLVAAGLEYHRSGKLDPAEALYLQALAVDPGSSVAAYDLGCVAVDRRNLGEAARWFREAVRLDPKNTSAAANLRWVLAQPAGTPAGGEPEQR